MLELFSYTLGEEGDRTAKLEQLDVVAAADEYSAQGFSLCAQERGDVRIWTEFPEEIAKVEPYLIISRRKPGLGQRAASEVEVSELLLKEEVSEFRDGYAPRVHFRKGRPFLAKQYRPPKVALSGAIRCELMPNKVKQFWLSMHVASDAAPGEYRGLLCVQSDQSGLQSWELNLRVLPFCLDDPQQDLLMWFRGSLDPRNVQHFLPEAQYREQMRCIRLAGFSSVSIHESEYHFAQRAVEIAEECGFLRNIVLYPPFPRGEQSLQTTSASLVYYLSDEFDLLGADYSAIHQSNWKEAKKHHAATIATIGTPGGERRFMDEQDIGHPPEILGYYLPTSTEIVKAQKAFKEVRPPFIRYYYWMAHMEKPLLHRLLIGHYLWKSEFDGVCPYVFQHRPIPPHSPYAHFAPWEPHFVLPGSSTPFRAHMATYPAREGVVSTLQWEGLKLGIQDLRYLSTLERYTAQLQDDPRTVVQSALRQGKLALQELHATISLRAIEIDSEVDPLPYQGFSEDYFTSARAVLRDVLTTLHESAGSCGG